MPTFYFDFWNGKRIEADEFGLELSDQDAAFEMAIRTARDMLNEPGKKYRAGCAFQVRSESGRALFTAPFSMAAFHPHDRRRS
jgi:hypothetical protein